MYVPCYRTFGLKKSMKEATVPCTTTPVLLLNDLQWSLASSSQRVGLLAMKLSRHHKPNPPEQFGAVICGLRHCANYCLCHCSILEYSKKFFKMYAI